MCNIFFARDTLSVQYSPSSVVVSAGTVVTLVIVAVYVVSMTVTVVVAATAATSRFLVSSTSSGTGLPPVPGGRQRNPIHMEG